MIGTDRIQAVCHPYQMMMVSFLFLMDIDVTEIKTTSVPKKVKRIENKCLIDNIDAE
jgi:hypothetical protein